MPLEIGDGRARRGEARDMQRIRTRRAVPGARPATIFRAAATASSRVGITIGKRAFSAVVVVKALR
jgi:hypothetical protein